MNLAIQRTVRRIEPNDGKDEERLSLFSDHLVTPNIILLGDPGAGKSHLFREAAVKENANFLTVRQFLVSDAEDFDSDTIYLDGLDEFRSRNGDLPPEKCTSLR